MTEPVDVETILAALRGRAGGTTGDGVARALAVLSEGRCPVCEGRSTAPVAVAADEDEETRRPSAVVHCQRCRLRWQTGPGPGGDWLSFAHGAWELTLNPPEDEDA